MLKKKNVLMPQLPNVLLYYTISSGLGLAVMLLGITMYIITSTTTIIIRAVSHYWLLSPLTLPCDCYTSVRAVTIILFAAQITAWRSAVSTLSRFTE